VSRRLEHLEDIADRVALMRPPAVDWEHKTYAEGHADALRRVEAMLRSLAKTEVDEPDVEEAPTPLRRGW